MTSPSGATRPLSVFEQLRSWILSGLLSPGQRLPVRDIARGLGISTMPVREALVRLEEAGLVTQEPRKGAIVSRLSLEDLGDFYNLRRLIEPQSIQLGVERMTPERLSRVRATMGLLDSAVSSGNLVTVLDLDEDLLALVHAAVANKQLARVIRSTWARVRPYKLLFTMTQTDAGHYIAEEDRQLIAAAEAGDGTGAFQLIDSSLERAHLRLADLLRFHQTGDISTPPGALIAYGESLATVIARLASPASEPA